MKILITGATGFIGRVVYQKIINSEHEIYAISRSKEDERESFYKLDILDHGTVDEFIKSIKPDILIHLAWDVEHGKFWDSPKNQLYKEASLNLFNSFLDNAGSKIIATGTCAEYSESPKQVEESTPQALDLLTPYGKAKREISDYLAQLKRDRDFDYSWLRIFGIFGPGEDERRFFPSAIKSIESGSEFKIMNSNNFFDYVYVDDLAEYIVFLVQKRGMGAVNIGTGKSISAFDLYKTIEQTIKLGEFGQLKTTKKAGENSRIPNCQKIQESGFSFDKSLQRGLRSAIRVSCIDD